MKLNLTLFVCLTGLGIQFGFQSTEAAAKVITRIDTEVTGSKRARVVLIPNTEEDATVRNPNSGPQLILVLPGTHMAVYDYQDRLVPHNPSRMTNFISLKSSTQNGPEILKTFTIRNEGTTPLTIFNIRNTLHNDNNQIEIVLEGRLATGFPVILASEEVATFSLRISPAINWMHLGYIEITSDDTSSGAAAAMPTLSIARKPSGAMLLTGTGAPFLPYQIQAKNDLFSSWQDLGAPITANSQGVFSYEDTDAPNHTMRFYRVQSPSNSRAMMFNVAGAIGAPAPLVCPGDSNNSVPPGFSCAGQLNGAICGGSSSGRTKVCNSSQCVLLGDMNGDGDVTDADIDEFENQAQVVHSNLSANFSCSGSVGAAEDFQGFADALAAQNVAEYNSRARSLCSGNTSEFLSTRGRALVFKNGPLNFSAMIASAGGNLTSTTPMIFKQPVEVCVDNLGVYDPETGVKVSGNAGALNGKYGETRLFSIDRPEDGMPKVFPISSESNDFRVNFMGDEAITPRQAILWSAEAQLYSDVNEYRSRFFNDAFIKELNLPTEIEKNLLTRQFRPDLNMSPSVTRLGKPRLYQEERYLDGGISLYPWENSMEPSLRTRGDANNYSSLPPLAISYDSQVTIGDYAGLMAFWVLGNNRGFPSEAFFGYSSGWKTNILPALNDGISAWIAYRLSGDPEIYRYNDYLHRIWAGRTCGGTNIPCNKGENIRNVMLWAGEGQYTTRDGVFPFQYPSNLNDSDGPTSSDLSALFFGAVFYDIANEAGLGLHKTDLIVWKTISLITNNVTFPMIDFGNTVIAATNALWPDGRYTADVTDVLVSRGIPVGTLPTPIGDASSLDVNAASKFGSQHPELQPSIDVYGNYGVAQNGYTHPDATASYVAYRFYKHSKYGPCDKLALTGGSGSFTVNPNEPFNWNYNNNGSYYTELADREPGNMIVLVPGRHIRWLRSRQRCPNEATGFYAEDVQPFGFSVVQAISNGFSFTVSRVSSSSAQKVFGLSIVDPSRTSIGPATYSWTITDYLGNQTTTTGATTQISVPVDQPFTLQITRLRSEHSDTITLRERANDFDRYSGNAFVRNLVP